MRRNVMKDMIAMTMLLSNDESKPLLLTPPVKSCFLSTCSISLSNNIYHILSFSLGFGLNAHHNLECLMLRWKPRHKPLNQ